MYDLRTYGHVYVHSECCPAKDARSPLTRAFRSLDERTGEVHATNSWGSLELAPTPRPKLGISPSRGLDVSAFSVEHVGVAVSDRCSSCRVKLLIMRTSPNNKTIDITIINNYNDNIPFLQYIIF